MIDPAELPEDVRDMLFGESTPDNERVARGEAVRAELEVLREEFRVMQEGK